MAKVSLSEDMQERPQQTEEDAEIQNAGPFVTISREFGCYGFSLGLLLMEVLNDEADPSQTWKIYHKEILARLASETKTAADLLERERRAKPRPFLDFFRAFKRDRPPSGYAIRNRITTLIRGLAVEGHAIIIGQGGAGATADLPNGLSVRLEAPLDWRVKEAAFREGLTETEGLPRAGLRRPLPPQARLPSGLRLLGVHARTDRPARGVRDADEGLHLRRRSGRPDPPNHILPDSYPLLSGRRLPFCRLCPIYGCSWNVVIRPGPTAIPPGQHRYCRVH